MKIGGLIYCFLLFFSCNSTSVEKNRQLLIDNKADSVNTSLNIKNQKIVFEYHVKQPTTNICHLEIDACLINKTSDSIYFLSMTCFGEQWSLRFDTSKIDNCPTIVCNASYPSKRVIAPYGIQKFNVGLRLKKPIKNIQLGFDFYEVNQTFQFSKIGNELNNFNRPKEHQTIIWGKETTLLTKRKT